MAIRNIRPDSDEILRKKSREVEIIDNKIRELVIDMLDTMYKYDGVGLAAPQIGILKRIICYDTGLGPKILINPVIKKTSGCQSGEEGCLSSPNVFGIVDRPENILVEAIDIDGKKVKVKGKDLDAVVISHEIDHLNGILFLDLARDVYRLTDKEIAQAKEEERIKQDSKNNKKNIKRKK